MSTDQERPSPESLEQLRCRIDEIDHRLVETLGLRAQLVSRVGDAKRGDGTPIYAPDREKRVIERALELNRENDGALPDRTIEGIYRELMSGSFTLERAIRIGYLGPPGTFSHVAAVRQFGSSVELVQQSDIESVFEEVEAGRVNYGLVPYENSIGGSVTDTLDAFQSHSVLVYAEALVEVRHALLANCPIDEITAVHSKPQAFTQCRKWLQGRFSSVERVDRASTAHAVEAAANTPGVAAIGSPLAGEIYGVKILFEGISHKADNITRFLVIGSEEALRTGEDRTTIMFTTVDAPGALVEVLNCFRDAKVNLSHIDKRPSGRENWNYTFFVDALGHRSEAPMQAAVDAAKAHCVELKVLGSYPRAQRVL
jgi:chorismate mutase/prephenate dehydratase